jgi:hypothetical protein
MGVRGQGAALTGFEIHDIVADPGHVAPPVMFEDAFAPFAQLGECHAEGRVARLRTGD